MNTLIVGSVAYDGIETIHGTVDRVLGGSATYASLAASFFGPVMLVGVVGEDFQEEHLLALKARGIDLSGLERREGRTFYWRGRYSPDFLSRTTLTTELNVFAHFEPVLPEEYRSAPFVFLANIAPQLQARVLEQVDSPHLVLADTMNLWIETAREELLDLLKRVNLLVLNDEEARQLTGEDNLIRAGRRLLTLGPARVIIKKGEHGAIAFSEDDYFVAPAYPLEQVVDPTGAGDSFAGALVGYLAAAETLTEGTLRRAILYATAVASLAVEDFGPNRLLSASPDEVQDRVETIRRLMAVES